MKSKQVLTVDHSRRSNVEGGELNEKDIIMLSPVSVFKGSNTASVGVKMENFIPADELEKELKTLSASILAKVQELKKSSESTHSAIETSLEQLPQKIEAVLMKNGKLVEATTELVSIKMQKFVDRVEKTIGQQMARNDEQDKKIALQEKKFSAQADEIQKLKKQMQDLMQAVSKK
ncbi:MAG: hypothetical protein P1V18_04655 [Candidatus Gracilibacteria bacterium]|nr:hypothetical protein [Candidatus Gracilibacteria bacterium]